MAAKNPMLTSVLSVLLYRFLESKNSFVMFYLNIELDIFKYIIYHNSW